MPPVPVHDSACAATTAANRGTGASAISLNPSAAISAERRLPAELSEWRVLGIESSCDDTGAAVISGTGQVLSLSVSLSLSLSVCLPVLSCLSVCLSVCLSCLSVCLSVCLPACLPVCLSACLPVCLSVC